MNAGMHRGGRRVTAGDGFDSLFGEIGAELLEAPLDVMGGAITRALVWLTEFLDLGWAALGLVDPADGRLRAAHMFTPPGATDSPIRSEQLTVAWLAERVRERGPIMVSG